jgi:hypothetical protein
MAIQTFHAGVLARKNAGGPPAGCNTERFNNNAGFDDISDFGFYTWLANRFTAPATFTNCKSILRLSQNGTVPAGTLEAMIYTVSGGNPGTLVGTGSATVDRTTISGGDVQVDFTGISAVENNATDYFMVLHASATDGGSSNCVRWIRSAGANAMRGSTDGISWDDIGTGILNFKQNST